MQNIITNELFALRDEKYKEFNLRIVSTAYPMIGVRSPKVKEIAKKYAKTDTGADFLENLPHKYYEENMLHAYMLGFLKEDTDILKEKISSFLVYTDNWAVCDSMVSCLKNFFKKPDDVYDFLKECLKSTHTYTVRFGLVALLDYYIGDKYIDDVLHLANEVKSEEYYIKMAQAWLYSVAFAKFYDKTLDFFKAESLDRWVHNKSIQKARESLRITKEQKEYLNTLKIK